MRNNQIPLSQILKVENLTTGAFMERSLAQRKVEKCASVWVQYGRTIRDLSIAEAMQKMPTSGKEHGVYQGGLCSPR